LMAVTKTFARQVYGGRISSLRMPPPRDRLNWWRPRRSSLEPRFDGITEHVGPPRIQATDPFPTLSASDSSPPKICRFSALRTKARQLFPGTVADRFLQSPIVPRTVLTGQRTNTMIPPMNRSHRRRPRAGAPRAGPPQAPRPAPPTTTKGPPLKRGAQNKQSSSGNSHRTAAAARLDTAATQTCIQAG
jgi:hypothetical protein